MVGVGLVVEVEAVEEDVVSVVEEEAMVVEICNMSQVVTMTMVIQKCLPKAVVVVVAGEGAVGVVAISEQKGHLKQ